MRRLPFQKGYVGNWSEETFLVRAQMPTVPMTYRLTDLSGEDIKGTFYSDELLPICRETRRRAVRCRTYIENEEAGEQDRVSRQVARISSQVQFVGGSSDEAVKVNGFHLILPSNSSMTCYPNNTVAQFVTKQTKLLQTIELNGVWDVALTEISFPIRLPNVLPNTCSFTVLSSALEPVRTFTRWNRVTTNTSDGTADAQDQRNST